MFLLILLLLLFFLQQKTYKALKVICKQAIVGHMGSYEQTKEPDLDKWFEQIYMVAADCDGLMCAC